MTKLLLLWRRHGWGSRDRIDLSMLMSVDARWNALILLRVRHLFPERTIGP